MDGLDIAPNQSISHVEEIPFESVYTSSRRDFRVARDCENAEWKCCKNENRSMVIDLIGGFYPPYSEEIAHDVK